MAAIAPQANLCSPPSLTTAWYITVCMRGRVSSSKGGRSSQREAEGCSTDWISNQAMTERIRVERTDMTEEATSQVSEVAK